MTAPIMLDRGRIRVAGVLVYLERALAPPGPLPPSVVPRPHGVASAAMTPEKEVVAAVAEGEVVWLGFQPVHPREAVLVRVRMDTPQPQDAVTGADWAHARTESPRNYLSVPPDSRLVGVPRPEGIHPFAAPAHLTILVGEPAAAAVVHLVRPPAYQRLTGEEPAPLDPGSAYTGWRAP